MIIKYIGFIFTLLWSYTFIKSQSIFKKGSGILITLFVSNISWLTFIAACYYGFKNFSFYQVLLGIALSIILVHLAFAKLSLYINSKFDDKNKLLRIKTFIDAGVASLSRVSLFIGKKCFLFALKICKKN